MFDIVPDGFYDPPERDDLELIQSEYDKLYKLAQCMAEALEKLKMAKEQKKSLDYPLLKMDAWCLVDKALTKWTEFKK